MAWTSSVVGDQVRVASYWLTLRQANELGGSVRKGEQSQIVVFWRVDETSHSEAEPDPEKLETDASNRRRFVLYYYRVWNVEQCDLPQAALDMLPKIQTYGHDPIEAADRIIAKCRIRQLLNSEVRNVL
jgi:antirestriction protein ArdC